MSIKPIEKPLAGERVIALSPETANAAATDWLRRPNLFAGRALTAPTLQQRQGWQASRIALRGQAFSSGVAQGLGLSCTIEPGPGDDPDVVRLQITPGRALAVSGEDVVLPTPVDVRLADLPVVAEPAVFAEAGGEAPPTGPAPGGLGVLRPRTIGSLRLGALIAVRSDIVPPVGVLVLQPIVADRSDFDPTDPCDRCQCAGSTEASQDSFEDWRTADGVRLLWYAWPDEWRALPPDTARRRNALAHIVFDAEAALESGESLPWEGWGAPIAVIGVNAEWQPVFADRATVVRHGGRARNARLTSGADGQLRADTRLPGLWQARIEQLAEQMAEVGNPLPDAAVLAQAFGRLPPAGLLPINVMNLDVLPLNVGSETLQSRFFPAGFELDAVPVPLPQLDVAIREAAPLSAVDFSTAERVRVLVPVTQASYEPRLLFEETVAAEFQQTVDRFALTRARALGARQGLRINLVGVTRAVTGALPEVPAFDDDPLALEREELTPWGPPPLGGGHRAALAAGLHRHEFSGATATIAAGAGNTLYAWIYLDPDYPPQTVMLQWHAGGTWEHRAYWGANLIALGTNGTPSRQQIDGTLPAPGRWMRVTVDPAQVGLNANTPIDGMAFTLFDGRAAFGATGLALPTGDTVWFSNALPAGATVGGDYDWDFLTENDLWAPFEPLSGGTSPLPAVAELIADPVLTPLSTVERAQLEARGVEGFIAYLKSRADRADDLVDYGFLKVQTDVYRVRQLVLGTTAATRLAVSPALATIAQAETAVASQEQISTFYNNLIAAPAAAASQRISAGGRGGGSTPAAFEIVAPSISGRRQAPPEETPAGARQTRPGISAAGTGLFAGSAGGATALFGSGGSGAAAVLAGSATGAQGLFGGGSGGAAIGLGTIVDLEPSLPTLETRDSGAVRALTQEVGLIGISGVATRKPTDVINAQPIIGKANIRTTAIAQRLEDPKSIEAKDYTAATRHDAVAALVRLAEQLRNEDGGVTPGLFDGIDVYGVRGDPFLGADNVAQRLPLSAFITDRTRLTQLLTTPARTRTVPGAAETLPDEGAYFSDSADLSDNTVALMRQLEGRIKLYRDAIAAAQATLAILRDGLARGHAGLAAIADRLAEARHDVSVARALLAEETERITGINQRRASVLADEVRFLAFVRPRESDNLAAVPRHQVDPGLIEAPAPGCLDEHPDVPDELTRMLRVVREAPAQWFADVPRLFDRLDRSELLVSALQSAQARTPLLTAVAATLTAAPVTRLAGAITSMQSRQLQVVGQARSLASQIDLTRVRGLTWQGARDQATQVVSLGDLIEGEHGRGEVARRAAQTFEEIGRIAACLHAGFSDVLPSIRMDWAETLSQFDDPSTGSGSSRAGSGGDSPGLRRLGGLARWGEISYVDRYRLQGLTDWLFSRINPAEPRAESLMNDVVRMCLLLASHAPVGRIIAGRLPRPITVRPGVRLPLTAFDPGRLRVGMEALVYRESQLVARAIVEDIGAGGAGEIATRVIHTTQPQLDLDVNVRVQFGAAASLSRAAASAPALLRR